MASYLVPFSVMGGVSGRAESCQMLAEPANTLLVQFLFLPAPRCVSRPTATFPLLRLPILGGANGRGEEASCLVNPQILRLGRPSLFSLKAGMWTSLHPSIPTSLAHYREHQ